MDSCAKRGVCEWPNDQDHSVRDWNPAPVMNRFGPSILLEAGDQKLIFDVGRGAIQRLTPQ
jgi:hypothetical protein